MTPTPDYVVNAWKANWWIFIHWELPFILIAIVVVFVFTFVADWYENSEDKEEANLSILHNEEEK